MARIARVYLLSAALVLGSVGLVSAQPDVADIPSQQLSVAGDPNLSYFLIGPVAKETPAQGYGLIVVLPGGDGKADSLAFVKRVYKNSLGGKYIVAQPIAVTWSRRVGCAHQFSGTNTNNEWWAQPTLRKLFSSPLSLSACLFCIDLP